MATMAAKAAMGTEKRRDAGINHRCASAPRPKVAQATATAARSVAMATAKAPIRSSAQPGKPGQATWQERGEQVDERRRRGERRRGAFRSPGATGQTTSSEPSVSSRKP